MRKLHQMIRIIISILLLLSAFELAAQTNAKSETDTLVGLVVNPKGKAMRNIPVTFPGKALQQTNRKGLFVFPNVSLSDTLTLLLPQSRIWQIPISGMSFLKITIRDDQFSVVEAKDEIIHIGYGTVNRQNDVSGNVTISGDELRKNGQTDLMQALIGRVSGLTIDRTADGERKIVIRGGATSFYLDNSALIVIDDILVDNMDHVDIHSVESVTVMKDASIYGVRGANGAVIVQTKIN